MSTTASPELDPLDVAWIGMLASDREAETWKLFLETARLIRDHLDSQLTREQAIGISEFEILAHLHNASERRLRMSELSRLTVAPKSRLTYRIDQLVARGWVVREECETDRRGLFAVLTEDGAKQLIAAAPGHVTTMRKVFYDQIQDEELAVFTRILTRINDAVRG
jgi:DNA-binding MarR family transcriptional regulator